MLRDDRREKREERKKDNHKKKKKKNMKIKGKKGMWQDENVDSGEEV